MYIYISFKIRLALHNRLSGLILVDQVPRIKYTVNRVQINNFFTLRYTQVYTRLAHTLDLNPIFVPLYKVIIELTSKFPRIFHNQINFCRLFASGIMQSSEIIMQGTNQTNKPK